MTTETKLTVLGNRILTRWSVLLGTRSLFPRPASKKVAAASKQKHTSSMRAEEIGQNEKCGSPLQKVSSQHNTNAQANIVFWQLDLDWEFKHPQHASSSMLCCVIVVLSSLRKGRKKRLGSFLPLSLCVQWNQCLGLFSRIIVNFCFCWSKTNQHHFFYNGAIEGKFGENNERT